MQSTEPPIDYAIPPKVRMPVEIPHCYRLERLERRFRYPYRLSEIGWMPHHLYIHDHTVITGCFVCLSCNHEGCSEALVDGRRLESAGDLPHFSILPPGTRIHTLRATYHDELYFKYPPECVAALLDFFGPEVMKSPRFSLSGFPEEIIAEIRDELLNPDAPGAADRLDQLAIRLFSEILLRFRAPAETGRADRLKLHAIAAELRRGAALAPLLKKHGYSERTFYREWRRVFKLSPNAYKLGNMLDSARALLSESELKPAEIAERCGFGSTVYFYQQFRKRLGTTPLEYREATRNQLFS